MYAFHPPDIETEIMSNEAIFICIKKNSSFFLHKLPSDNNSFCVMCQNIEKKERKIIIKDQYWKWVIFKISLKVFN